MLLYCAAFSAMGGIVSVLRFFDIRWPHGWWSVSNPSALWAVFFSLIALGASVTGIFAIRSAEKRLRSQTMAWKEESDAKNEREGRLNECKSRIVELEKELTTLRKRLEVKRGHNL